MNETKPRKLIVSEYCPKCRHRLRVRFAYRLKRELEGMNPEAPAMQVRCCGRWYWAQAKAFVHSEGVA